MKGKLREVLGVLEHRLSSRINKLTEEFSPLEQEMARIRRAQAALDAGDPPEVSLDGWQGRIAKSLYADSTMKGLVLQVLGESFAHGATTRELLEFFRSAWGRTDVMRSSLSP